MPDHDGHTPHFKRSRFIPDAQSGDRGRLLIACPDKPGIIAGVSQFLFTRGANIVESSQHSSIATGEFFMRVEFDLPSLHEAADAFRQDFAVLAAQFSMEWKLEFANRAKRVAIFVSREEHCLQELLWQWQVGDLFADITAIVSNHAGAAVTAQSFGIPFHHTPVSREHKSDAERAQMAVVGEHIDLIILARYMQILSPAFVRHFDHRIINIHHSFLPSFVGQNPYGRAHDRGVKLIGATAHYVTEELDAGPIIEQDVERIDHRYEAEDLKRIGRYVERTVLARAVRWHLEDRVLVRQNKTIVFA